MIYALISMIKIHFRRVFSIFGACGANQTQQNLSQTLMIDKTLYIINVIFHFARSIKRLYHWQFSKEVFSNREYRGQSETLENRVYDGFSPPQAPKNSGFLGIWEGVRGSGQIWDFGGGQGKWGDMANRMPN